MIRLPALAAALLLLAPPLSRAEGPQPARDIPTAVPAPPPVAPAAPAPLPGRWLFTPSDTEAGLDPQLGWIVDGSDRFTTLFLVCRPHDRTLEIAIETDPADASRTLARSLHAGTGTQTLTAVAEERSGGTWLVATRPYDAAAALLAGPGPWRIGDAPGVQLADPEAAAAFRAFRQSCGLGPG